MDSKILRLRAKYGWEGYAFYFAILEWMYQASDTKVSNSDITALSLLLNKDEIFVKDFISHCISIELFVEENNQFYSIRLFEEKKREIEKSAKARESVRFRELKKNRKKNGRSSNDTSNDHLHPPTHPSRDANASPPTRDELEGLMDAFEKISGQTVRARTPQRKKKLAFARRNFTDDEIKRAWVMMSRHKFLNGENPSGKRYFDIDYGSRIDRIESYLNESERIDSIPTPPHLQNLAEVSLSLP